MALVRSSRTRKRKHIDYCDLAADDATSIEIPEQEEKGEEATVELLRSLAQSEADDLEDLISIASEATVIEFDSRTGRPIRRPSLNENDDDDDDDDDDSPIDGLVKISDDLLHENDPGLFRDLTKIHSIVKQKVQINDMVPWAGIDGDSTRLRSFGFLGRDALTRLDRGSAVRLHAPEKQGRDAIRDERANRRAICVLNKTRERVVRTDVGSISTEPKTVNPTLVADKLCRAILANRRGDKHNNNNKNNDCYLNSNVLCSKELIAYQTNLHNGAKHLAAHLDAPLHEGFGKVIVTVAIRGSATILLIGKGDEGEEDIIEEDDEKSDHQQEQPAWKFHLKEGEAYVLSGNARNICLHAVLANDGGIGGDRESLNLRFGIHSIEEAEQDIKRHWPDLW